MKIYTISVQWLARYLDTDRHSPCYFYIRIKLIYRPERCYQDQRRNCSETSRNTRNHQQKFLQTKARHLLLILNFKPVWMLRKIFHKKYWHNWVRFKHLNDFKILKVNFPEAYSWLTRGCRAVWQTKDFFISQNWFPLSYKFKRKRDPPNVCKTKDL